MDCHEHDINAGSVFGQIFLDRKKFTKEFNREIMSGVRSAQQNYGKRTYLILDKDLEQDKYFKQSKIEKGSKRGIPNRHYFIWDEQMTNVQYLKEMPFDQFAGMFAGRYDVIVSREEIKKARKTRDYYSLIDFTNICVVPKGGLYFDMFFALSFYFTDPEDLNDFFSFQLNKNFSQKKEVFDEYLENIIMKYEFFLSEKHEKKIKKFFLGLETPVKPFFSQKKNTKKINKKNGVVFFLKEEIKKIADYLSPFLDEEDKKAFNALLEGVDIGSNKVLFKGSKRKFIFFIHSLEKNKKLSVSTYAELARWVCSSFYTIYRGNITDFKFREVSNILSKPSIVRKSGRLLGENYFNN
jgi:hypothetical protein